jgi:putative membrane protein
VGGLIVVNLIVSLVTVVLLQMIGVFIFTKVMPLNEMEELKNGNAAVGVAMGGEFLATAVILGAAAYSNSAIWYVALWFVVGFACLLITYKVFDWLTPGLKLSEHLHNGNIAVGILLACVFVGISISISSLII